MTSALPETLHIKLLIIVYEVRCECCIVRYTKIYDTLIIYQIGNKCESHNLL